MLKTAERGFTLIELSIVLVIIGLIIGGILVGRDLIKAAEIRAQIAQIEKYKSAVNTFRTKYDAVPGDMASGQAQALGFYVGNNCDGHDLGYRNGNGILEANGNAFPLQQAIGEVFFFWQDLGNANLIDGKFPGGGAAEPSCGAATIIAQNALSYYYPVAKIGYGNYVYVYEVGGVNWYGVSAVTSVTGGANLVSNTSIPVIQAYNVDKKMDDGLAITGNVMAMYLNNSFAAGSQVNAPNTNPDTSATCYNSSTGIYSISVNSGSGPNCAISFQF